MARKKKDAAPADPPEVEYVTIYADIHQETEDAILVDCDCENHWLPKSQSEFSGDVGDEGVEITIPEWLAEERGLSHGQGYKAPVGDPETEGMPDAEDAAADTDGQDGDEEPAPQVVEALTFKADVVAVHAESFELLIREPDEGNAQNFILPRSMVRFDGDDTVDLEPGYEGIPFTMSWEDAEFSGVLKFLGAEAPAPVQAEEAPQDDDGDEQPQAAPYRRKLREELITVPITLNPEEREAVGQRMADAIELKEELEDDLDSYRKSINAKIKEAEKEFREASKLWNKGREEREISCDVIGDYNTGELVWCEKSWPYREVKRQPMTEKDRQIPLPMDFAPAPAAQSAADSQCGTCKWDNSEHCKDCFGEEMYEAKAEDQGAQAEPDTVTLSGTVQEHDGAGVRMAFGAFKDGSFQDCSFEIPAHEILDSTPETEDIAATVTMRRAYALEQGIIEDESAEEAPEQDRSCGTCGRIHETPEGDEDDPCRDCQPEAFPNWRPLAVIPDAAPETQAVAEV